MRSLRDELYDNRAYVSGQSREERAAYVTRNRVRAAPMDEIARPEWWEEIDRKRRGTGAWKDMKVIRVRLADDAMTETDFTVIEINVKNGEVFGVRVLQRGAYGFALHTGPFIFWKIDSFVEWFSQETEMSSVRQFRQLWHNNRWVGHQTALVELLEVFTS